MLHDLIWGVLTFHVLPCFKGGINLPNIYNSDYVCKQVFDRHISLHSYGVCDRRKRMIKVKFLGNVDGV